VADAFSIGGETTLIEERGDEKIGRIYTLALPSASESRRSKVAQKIKRPEDCRQCQHASDLAE